jgi:uncharacterized membrane protein YkvA (DUF1232 family)
MPDASPATLKISFELTDKDFGYFRDKLQNAMKDAQGLDEAALIAGAKGTVDSAIAAAPPEFVRGAITELKELIAMLEDKEWRLEGELRARVLSALSYFVEPNDLIPDSTPGIGYLDDAIMISLVARELGPEIESYRAFVSHRAVLPTHERQERLAALRERLHAQLVSRRYDTDVRPMGSPNPWSPFRLF